MKELRVKTVGGSEVALGRAEVEEFMGALRGGVLFGGSEGYDDVRKIHNGMIDRCPAMIVRCAGDADVMAAVRFAREHDLLISVRGGGHGVPGFSVCEGGLMVDLSLMKGVRVDPQERTARAEGGVTWGEFDHETQAFGLATTGGVARPTGVAGLTLGGGHGFLMRKHGLACDNLVSVDIVLSDGRRLTAAADRNEDLFWAVRGGGGNFGVATAFQFRLHTLGQILAGRLLYPFEKAREVLRLYRELTASAPEELGAVAALATLPDGTRIVGCIICWIGPLDEGERLLRPLRGVSPIIADEVGPTSYGALQSIAENFNPRGLRNYWKSEYLTGIDDPLVDLLVGHYEKVPAPHSHLVIEHLGGAVSRIGDDETAVSYRNAEYNLLIVGMWEEAGEDEKVISWVRDLYGGARSFSSGGGYINYMGAEADEGAERIRAAYGSAKYERLAALKRKYDPGNLFRLNQNIKPAS